MVLSGILHASCRTGTQTDILGRVPFNDLQPVAAPSSNAGYSFLVQATNLTSCPGTCIRPVGLAFSKSGRLFVSSDSSGELFVISKQE
jgi:hypothetical protein